MTDSVLVSIASVFGFMAVFFLWIAWVSEDRFVTVLFTVGAVLFSIVAVNIFRTETEAEK